jgi:DNA mismatch endonuclease (patch repair protein)
MTDVFSTKKRSEVMSRIRSKDTSAELIVRRLVYAMGFRYRLHVARLPGRPDVVLSRLKKIIEVRGCFWHQHKGCSDAHIPKSRTEYWGPKLARNVSRDRDNERLLRSLGWQILPVWECETRDRLVTAKRLRVFLGKKRRS